MVGIIGVGVVGSVGIVETVVGASLGVVGGAGAHQHLLPTPPLATYIGYRVLPGGTSQYILLILL